MARTKKTAPTADAKKHTGASTRASKVPAGDAVSAKPATKARSRAVKGPPFPIVGIGASAGGLEAYEQFFTAMPPDSGMAFVLVQHLDPTHKSILTDLMQRYTRMRVLQVEDGMRVEPDCVYVIPPNRDMAILHGTLHLIEPVARRGQRAPIDTFFRSLAQDQQERAICIVLSGTGSEGTLGLKAIKGEGGMVMVQDPASAKYDGMPRNAAETGLADYVLAPDKMPAQLLAYVRHSGVPTRRADQAAVPMTTAALRKVFILLRDQTGHDFSYYKQNTIIRRIERRMAVHQLPRIDQYVHYLQNNPIEVETLFKELLIEVTSFFRDPEAFAALKERVVAPLVAQTRPNQTLRVWVPGCSTGEEAYSLAMLFREHADEVRHEVRVQVFATDIDTNAIDTARAAIYPAGIATDVSPERLQRFFDKGDATYRVKRAVRDMLVFAPQNLIRDPPFSKLDLISCRNLLIYMGPELQARVLPVFHYALKAHGYLFLGTSETIGARTDIFATVDRKWKLFQRTGEATRQPMRLALPAFRLAADTMEGPAATTATGGPLPTLHDLTQRALLDRYCPPCVVIDEKCNVQYIHGRTGRYLEPASGEPTANLLTMAREGLRLQLTAAVRKCLVTKEAVRHERVRVAGDGGLEMIDLTVAPLPGPPAQRGMMMVVFEEVGREEQREAAGVPADPSVEGGLRVVELEHELRATREYLQTTIEELETVNEEHKSANEELQSANEELQSSNEELETSKEELQSVNEELVTVNSELETKLDELSKANNDLNNLLGATRIGTVFLDKNLRIQRFTPDAANLIHLIPADVGRPLSHIVTKFPYDRLADDVEAVLDTLVPREVEVHTHDGAWYAMRVMPYRTTENVIDGVVITFADISQQKRVQGDLRKLTEALEQCRSDVLITDAEGAIEYVNRSFTETSGYTLDALYGKRLGQLEPGGRNGAFFEQLAETIHGGEPWQGEFHHDAGNGERYCEWASMAPVLDDRGKVVHFIAVKEPYSPREKMRNTLFLRVGKALRGLAEWQRSAGEGAGEAALVNDLCRLLVEDAGYDQAWVGAPQANKTRTVRPMAAAGYPAGAKPRATWDDTPRGQSVTGQAIRTVKPAVRRYIHTDPVHTPWRSEAVRLGYGAACALPVALDDGPPWVLTLHAAEPDAFNEQEVALLAQLVNHMVETLRTPRSARKPDEGGTP